MIEIVEIGHFALVLALGISLAQTVTGVLSVTQKDMRSIVLSVRATKLTFWLVSLAFLALIFGFLTNDFSVKYIANNSNSYLPWYYKVSAVWGGHEGSLLLWVWTQTLWSYLVAIRTGTLPPHFRGKVIAILGVISFGFLSFVILTSTPFERILPTNVAGGFPLEGKDLNPILQDIGLIFHPPVLYTGYVGFAVSFAFITAALIDGRLDAQWARWCRPWTVFAWSFLTLGIAMGSWWAYYELGWGGWWFWDPVENASLMPWLAGTALIHALAATEKRDVFKMWTAFLAISTFSLSLIGTFLVRSGVLTSVHAFANDPVRGIYILLLLGLISGSAFLLLVLRAHKLRSSGSFELVSREMGILINNILLATGCLVVFIGTLAPLLYDVLGLERISVGAAYFNAKMLWVLLLLLVFIIFAPYLHWKRDRLPRLVPILITTTILATGFTYGLLSLFDYIDWQAFILMVLVITAMLTSLFDAFQLSFTKRSGWKMPSLSYMAMFTGHMGFLVSCVGIILTSTYSIEKDMYVEPGAKLALKDLSFEAKGISQTENDQYQATTIDFLVRDENNKVMAVMSPEKRLYRITNMPISESDLLPGMLRDVYVALGEPQGNTQAWSVRLQIKPFIRWIWLGSIIMAGVAWFVFRDRRYYLGKTVGQGK